MRFRKQKLETTIAFTLPGFLNAFPKEWTRVEGLQCVGLNACDPIPYSRIRIVRVSHSRWRSMRLSGDFEVRLSDGRKLEGSFEAKEIKPSKDVICE